MNEEKKNPINLLTDALANMTLTAIEAERERDDAQKRGDEWYKLFQKKEAENKELQAMLAAEIKGHQKTKVELDQAITAAADLTYELEKLKQQKNSSQSLDKLSEV